MAVRDSTRREVKFPPFYVPSTTAYFAKAALALRCRQIGIPDGPGIDRTGFQRHSPVCRGEIYRHDVGKRQVILLEEMQNQRMCAGSLRETYPPPAQVVRLAHVRIALHQDPRALRAGRRSREVDERNVRRLCCRRRAHPSRVSSRSAADTPERARFIPVDN